MISRPKSGTYPAYFDRYLSNLPEGDVFAQLENGRTLLIALLKDFSERQWEHAYAEGKWNLKQLVGHLIDTERIFAYRALRLSRGDTTPLAGFDQDIYVANHNWNEHSRGQLLAEYNTVRQGTLHLFQKLSEEELDREGTVSDSPCTARAILFITVAHEYHHLGILKTRYLG